jgi:L-lactate dehydrogenase
VLDTARLRHGLARLLGVDAQNAHVHVIGEHSDSSFPAWSSATIGPFPLASYPLPPSKTLAALKETCAERTRRRGTDEILARKGYTDAAIAVAATRVVECVIRDRRRIYTVSTKTVPEYGVGHDAVLSLPCVIGREGVVRRLVLALNEPEQRVLERSAEILEAAYRRDREARAVTVKR